MRGQVFKSSQRVFDVYLDTGEMIQATAQAKVLKGSESVVVGDFVHLEKEEEYFIKSVEERKSEIFRILVRENKKKVTAANCDLIVILSSVSRPAFKRGIVDRFLVRSSQWQIPAVVLNKMDQLDSDEVDLSFEASRLSDLDVDVFGFSAKNPDHDYGHDLKSFRDLAEKLKGKTALFLGQSGVGKSATISSLSGGEFELKTGEVGKVGKGAHTTTWSEIVDLDDFRLIDSPGIRSFSLDDIHPDELISFFPDVEDISLRCKFRDCGRQEHSKRMCFSSVRDDEYSRGIQSRLESYQRILEEIKQTPWWEKNTNNSFRLKTALHFPDMIWKRSVKMTDKLLDFVGKRAESIEKKRRNFERVLFQNFLGAYSVLDQQGTVTPVQLVDVSHTGCLFQIPWDLKKEPTFRGGEELNLRIYFTNDSFIPVIVKVKHTQDFVDQDGTTYLQYGCEFDDSMPSFVALKSFINFLYQFAEHSSVDKGDSRVYFL